MSSGPHSCVSMLKRFFRDLTPTEDEMANYRYAWRRHLVRYALSATNSGKALNVQIRAGQSRAAFTPASGVEERDWEAEGAADEKLIQEFEAKYWPTVILPLRQLALQDLKQKVCLAQTPRVATRSQQQFTVGGDKTIFYRTLEGGQSLGGAYCSDADAAERIIASSSNEAETDPVQGLIEEMADEVSVASEAELQMIKCIEQMQPCRFSKSVQFVVHFYALEVTLAAAYEAPACIRVKFDELYTHSAMYYDLRMQMVAAFEGVQITDNLMPNLVHRRVLVSQSCTKSQTEDHTLAEAWKGPTRDTPTNALLPSYGCASCGSKRIHGTPPLSPLQPVNTACILDWSMNCVRQGGCALEYSRKECEGEMRASQEAPAGGWLRIDKSYVPLEGIPDIRLYLQTHGSLLCTITPAALAYLVEALQQPVHMVEGSSILEAASREVQDALHRNELFLSQLLIGEVDHPTIDVCVDIPVSHKLLVPFSHENLQCRGVLFQSGLVSVDSRLKRPEQQRFAPGHTCISKAYDRYSIMITGACLQRVINCQQVGCGQSAFQIVSPSLLNGKTNNAKRSAGALAEVGTTEIDPHNRSSYAGPNCRWREELRTSSAAGRHRESMCDSTDNRVEMVDGPVTYEACETNDRLETSETMEESGKTYIMWPIGLVANIDVCNNLHSLTDLPAFSITFQDQDFRCPKAHHLPGHLPLSSVFQLKLSSQAAENDANLLRLSTVRCAPSVFTQWRLYYVDRQGYRGFHRIPRTSASCAGDCCSIVECTIGG